VTDRLSKDTALLASLRTGAAPGSAPFGSLLGYLQDCRRALVFAPQFARLAQDQAGGKLSAVQLGCLQDGYAGLTRDQADAVFTAGVSPGGPGTDDGKKIISDLRSKCGV